jgi:hypothetical protein
MKRWYNIRCLGAKSNWSGWSRTCCLHQHAGHIALLSGDSPSLCGHRQSQEAGMKVVLPPPQGSRSQSEGRWRMWGAFRRHPVHPPQQTKCFPNNVHFLKAFLNPMQQEAAWTGSSTGAAFFPTSSRQYQNTLILLGMFSMHEALVQLPPQKVIYIYKCV